jgi:hypothetical protein
MADMMSGIKIPEDPEVVCTENSNTGVMVMKSTQDGA